MRSDLALAALASAAVPGMKPVSVVGMAQMTADDEAGVQRALVEDATGRRWVVHAPLDAVAGARMQRNDELVRSLARHVPFKVPAPVGHASLGRDGYAAVYPYVDGAPLDLARLPAGQGLASAVARALAAVHNVPRAVFEEQDVPVFDAAGCRQRATAEVDRAAETGRVPTGLLARWEEAFDAPPLWQFATTPVHGSFGGSAVLVAFADEEDAATGRVVAVTDWGQAMVGDPAQDLTSIYAQVSPEAWESVLDSYALARTHRPDPYLHARARLLAETRVLHGLAAAVADGAEGVERKIVEALRRMDRLTEDEDSLVPVTARPRAGAPAPPVGRTPAAAAMPEQSAAEPRSIGGVTRAAGAHGVVGQGPAVPEEATERVPTPQQGSAPADEAHDADDLTVEVALPRLSSDEPPPGSDQEAGDEDEAAQGADRTAEDRGARPADEDPLDPAGENLDATSGETDEQEVSVPGDDLADPADRLSELYGMPDPAVMPSAAEDLPRVEPAGGTRPEAPSGLAPSRPDPDTAGTEERGTGAS